MIQTRYRSLFLFNRRVVQNDRLGYFRHRLQQKPTVAFCVFLAELSVCYGTKIL
jgi:hypothetical protein